VAAALTFLEPTGPAKKRHLIDRQEQFERRPARFALSPEAFSLVLALAVFQLFLSQRPLSYTDLWGHLAYGRLIVTEGRLPRTEPLLPLSRGIPFDDTAWLSQVLGYLAFRWQGIAVLQFLNAACITAALAVLAFAVCRRAAATWPAAMAAVLCSALEWQQFKIARPQLAGFVCFVVLFVFLTRRTFGPKRLWFGPVLFLIWANLHGSFIAGFVTIAAFGAGRAADLIRRSGKVRAVFSDERMRHLVGLALLGGVGALVNPYGWKIFQNIWETASNPNLADLVEWRGLGIQMRQGQVAAVVALSLAIVYCLTPRRVSMVEVLLLGGWGGASLWMSRMIVWWSPIAAYYLALHSAAICKHFLRRRRPIDVRVSSLRRRAWAVAAVMAILIASACSPLGAAVLLGVRADPHVSLSPGTPIDATAFLNDHPPRGQIFNTYEWGDYLLWAGPPRLKVFVASHAHLVPRVVWQDYMTVIGVATDWRKVLDRYRVNTVVVDADQHDDLVDALREDKAWSITYADAPATIFTRRHPVE